MVLSAASGASVHTCFSSSCTPALSGTHTLPRAHYRTTAHPVAPYAIGYAHPHCSLYHLKLRATVVCCAMCGTELAYGARDGALLCGHMVLRLLRDV
eukprot:967917-Rhodomonas_salina.1